jgi:hypothetical protein
MKLILGRDDNSSSTPSETPHIVIGVDALLVTGVLTWLVYKRVFYNLIIKKVLDFFRSPVDDESIDRLLAQIGILTGAHRVLLAKFHNGSLDEYGYHLQKVTTSHFYLAKGAQPMEKPIVNLPLTKIMCELATMVASPTTWAFAERKPGLPSACFDHLERNSILRMYNKLIVVGNLPVAILSLQYTDYLKVDDVSQKDLISPLMDELTENLSRIVKQQVTDPAPLKRIFNEIKNLSLSE